MFPDPGFESSARQFATWHHGNTLSLTSHAIDGKSSLEAKLAAGSGMFYSANDAGGGAVHATATIRNDGTSIATVSSCVGIYDVAWNEGQTCVQLTLAPGAVTPLSESYVIPSGPGAIRANWSIRAVSGAVTFALDDAYLGYAPN